MKAYKPHTRKAPPNTNNCLHIYTPTQEASTHSTHIPDLLSQKIQQIFDLCQVVETLQGSTFIFPAESWNCSWTSNLKGLRIPTGEKRNPVWYKISKEKNILPLGSCAFGLHAGLHLKWKCQSSDSSHISDNHNPWSETNVLTNCALICKLEF